ncbi:MAG: glycosyltransferase family 39 protein [Candidatus Aminicenantes bacterium]|nr:glycosyltransferase family 39 protein [Candidatus Aminicenantes bacterium]
MCEKYKNSLYRLLFLHSLIILGLLTVIVISGLDYRDLLLRDDGYYRCARQFVQGGSLMHRQFGPLLPLLYSPLFIFPTFLHPFLRVFLALSFSLGTLALLMHIVKDYITGKQFFRGGLFIILNPLYNHWILRSSPEIYLTFLLGLLIFFLVKYSRSGSFRYFLYAAGVFVTGIFVKPAFLLIPFALLLFAILTKSKKMAVAALVFTCTGIGGYALFNRVTAARTNFPGPGQTASPPASRGLKQTYSIYGGDLFIWNTFLTDYLIKTGQFHKGTLTSYKPRPGAGIYSSGGYFYEIRNKTARPWIENYFRRRPGGNYLCMNLYFIYDRPLLVLQKLAVSPLLFFSLSGRTAESVLMLFVTLFSLFFALPGIGRALKKPGTKKDILLIVFIIAGFSSLYLTTHAIGRYSVPILPYLYIWAGVTLSKSPATQPGHAARGSG